MCSTNIGYANGPSRHKDATKNSQRRRKNVLILVSKTSYIGLKWKSRRSFLKTLSGCLPRDVLDTSSRRRPQDVFQNASSRHLLGDVLKTSSRKGPQDIFQETSSRRLPGGVLRMSSTRRAQGLKTPEDFKTFSGQ